MTDPRPTDEIPGLGERLRRLYRPPVEVPPEFDASVRRRIREHFALRRGESVPPPAGFAARLYRVLPWPLAAAAAIAFALWLASPRAPAPGPQRADLDLSGRVDILDAFMLARRLAAGGRLDAALDVNDDGVVDAIDVDAIALRAVSLGGGTGS